MHFGSKNPGSPYKMGSVELGTTANERDLGVNFATDLKWREHINVCAAKANCVLGLIKRNFVNFDIELVKILYTVYVRPLIEFAVPVWNLSLKGDIESLEKIQRRVTKMVYELKDLSYEDRLEYLGLTTLEKRRIRGDLIQVFKIFNGFEKVELCEMPTFNSNIKTRGHSKRYAREISKNSARHNFLPMNGIIYPKK